MNGTDTRPVVVGIHHAHSARRAALWAADQAQRRRSPVRLVHALGVSALSFAGGRALPRDFLSSIEMAAADELDAVRGLLRRRSPELPVEMSLHPGNPVRMLVEQSKCASLLVLGAQEHDLIHNAVTGGTASMVAAHAACPTAIVPDDYSIPVDGPVVVGVDGSPASECAVGIAFEEAASRQVDLVAVHAWSDFLSDRRYRRACRHVLDWTDFETRERETLTERLAGWQEKYPDVLVRRVVARQRAAALLVTQARHAQLLVAGSRGTGGFRGRLLGSTSRKLIHSASCPVLIARPQPACA